MGLEQQPSVMEELSIKNGQAPGVGQGHKTKTAAKNHRKNTEKPRKCLIFWRFYGII